ncbi:MAG: ubiquitin-like small modifier protein 1 [Nitriliruptoraceae bacterium]
MPQVRIPTVLRRYTDGEAVVSAEGSSVGEVFTSLVEGRPELNEQLFDDGALRGYVNVYVRDEDIRYLDGLETKVEGDDEIAIMPAVAGGSAHA